MTPLFLVITENKAFAQLCRKALTNAGFQSSKLASACLSNGRKSVTALSPDYVLLDGDCQDNMDDYIISLAPRYSVPIIYLTIQHINLTALRLITSVFRNALPKAYSALKKQELILLCIYLP